MYGGEEICIKSLVGRPDGKRPLGRPRLRWEDNILELQELEWRGMASIDLIPG